jgi:hypothetical protein
LRELRDRRVHVALETLQPVDVLGCLFVALIFLKPAHQFRARILFVVTAVRDTRQ